MQFSALQPPRRLLFGPGPTMLEPDVYEALAKPLVGHLDPYFIGVLDQVREMPRSLFGTHNPLTWAISGTGSSGMETAIANFVEPDSKFAVLGCGFFGSRMAEMGRRQGARVATLEKQWGEICDYDEAETSTGALQDPRPIVKAAREVNALTIADCLTSLGGVPISVDETGIDIAYRCSQKGLSCPPGLAPFTASPRAVERLNARQTPVPEWYLDLRLLGEYFDGHKYHHTASATLFYALHESLRLIHEEGLENRFARHRRAHQTLARGFEGLGLRMHVPEGHRIPHLNTPRVPDGVDNAKVRKCLLEKSGIEIAGGFGPLANEECVQMFLGNFGAALKEAA